MGSFSVGKTSLIKRFVNSIFDDKYHTTVGVKIDKKEMSIAGTDLTFVIWDIAGEDDFASFRPIYLRGVSAYIIVIDGTRQHSLDIALKINQKSQVLTGGVPVVFALNKCDLEEQWVLQDKHLEELQRFDSPIIKTSAKTGQGVDDIFYRLGVQLIP
jgi:small GTP-binding protein